MNNQIYLSKEILNSLENPEIIPFKSGYKGYMVFSKEMNAELYKKYGIKNTHRYYACYDLRNGKSEDVNIITFILFDPSTANPKNPIDPTISNCIYLAVKNEYNYVEIINIFSYRCSTVSAKCTENNKDNLEFIKKIIGDETYKRDFVKAWGFGKENSSKLIQEQINSVKKILIENEKPVMRLGVKDDAIKKLKEKILHPAKSTWCVFGGFEQSAELVKD